MVIEIRKKLTTSTVKKYRNWQQGYIFFPIRGQMGRGKKSAFEKEGKKIKDEKGRKKKKREGKEKREKEGKCQRKIGLFL